MRRDLDISLIRAFLAVVDADGVTAAASVLGVSQAAASQQIKRLEEALDCRLFERRGRKLALAPAGERLLAQARRLLALNDEVWSAMRTPSFEGEVRLGVPYDIIGSFVPPILRRFAKAQPRVRVSLVCEDSNIVRDAAAIGRRRSRAHHRDRLRPPRRDAAHRPAGVGRRAGRRGASARSAAGVAGRADLRVPARRRRGAGSPAARLARGLRGEPARAGLCRDRGGAGGGAAAALLGAAALRGLRRQGGARGAPARTARVPHQSLCAAGLSARPRAISPTMCARASRCGDSLPGARHSSAAHTVLQQAKTRHWSARGSRQT